MRRSSISAVIILSMSLITMGFQCEKPHDELKPTYEFSEKVTLTPYKKVYNLNDTIWVQLKTADRSLFDKLSNKRVPTDSMYLLTGMTYNKRYPFDGVGGFYCDIKTENTIDQTFISLYALYNTLQFRTDCGTNPYYFKIGFIPKKAGIYSIDLPKNAAVLSCPGTVLFQYATHAFTFNLADCNKDIYLTINPYSRGGKEAEKITMAQIDNKEIFVFKVE